VHAVVRRAVLLAPPREFVATVGGYLSAGLEKRVREELAFWRATRG
jgi:hypothetical protein